MERSYLETPLGTLRICAERGSVTEILPAEEPREPAAPGPVTAAAARQLSEYFAGTRREFSLPLDPAGTAFQKRVWAALRAVPYGQTVTYGALAARVSCGSARAVGQAVGKNPVLIAVPCHRVLAADGIGGFSSGLPRKKILLNLEGIAWKD